MGYTVSKVCMLECLLGDFFFLDILDLNTYLVLEKGESPKHHDWWLSLFLIEPDDYVGRKILISSFTCLLSTVWTPAPNDYHKIAMHVSGYSGGGGNTLSIFVKSILRIAPVHLYILVMSWCHINFYAKEKVHRQKTGCMSVMDDSAGTPPPPFIPGTFLNMCLDLTCTLCVRMLVYVQTGWCMGLIPCIGFTIDQAGWGLLLTMAWEPESTYREQIHTECSKLWFLGLKLGVRYESCVIPQSGDWSGQILAFWHHNQLMPVPVRLI